MSADQKPDYRATPITQRDGSKLQNSNCRMASISTGLDFDTLGKKKSTGAKMRTYTTDQEGGTDSGDAKQAWDKGYGENLDIQDGKTWTDVLTDLKNYRLVHLDVWHATVGGPCLSGSGAYGHTMAVAPDCVDGKWLVADPWCKPGKWSRVSEAKLKAGAEEWGRRVYGAATQGPGSKPTREDIIAAVKRLMSRYHAGGEEDPSEDPGDTGGPQRVLYTATTGHKPKPPDPPDPPDPPSEDSMNSYAVPTKYTTVAVPSGTWLYYNSDMKANDLNVQVSPGRDMPVVGTLSDAYIVSYVDSSGVNKGKTYWLKKADAGALKTPTPPGCPTCPECPDCPECPEPIDCSDLVVDAVNRRDDEWREWLLDGAPGQREREAEEAEADPA